MLPTVSRKVCLGCHIKRLHPLQAPWLCVMQMLQEYQQVVSTFITLTSYAFRSQYLRHRRWLFYVFGKVSFPATGRHKSEHGGSKHCEAWVGAEPEIAVQENVTMPDTCSTVVTLTVASKRVVSQCY